MWSFFPNKISVLREIDRERGRERVVILGERLSIIIIITNHHNGGEGEVEISFAKLESFNYCTVHQFTVAAVSTLRRFPIPDAAEQEGRRCLPRSRPRRSHLKKHFRYLRERKAAREGTPRVYNGNNNVIEVSLAIRGGDDKCLATDGYGHVNKVPGA